MKASQLLLLAASTSLPSSAVAFIIPTHHALTLRIGGARSSASPSRATPLCRKNASVRQPRMTTNGNDEGTAPAPRTRRKRKDGQKFSPPSSAQPELDGDGAEAATAAAATASAPPAAPKPTENVVTMQVRDIRDVVSGAPAAAPADAPTDAGAGAADDDADLADDEEWEYYDVDADGNELPAADDRGAGGAPGGALERLNEILAVDGRDAGRARDESLEQLLADARSMRASSAEPAIEETPVRDAIFGAISTIVTVDFFVVIGLLLWFLAGIFCSTVLGSDTVQIAFNMNFERVTQPALGILMIGSVAGSFGAKEEEE